MLSHIPSCVGHLYNKRTSCQHLRLATEKRRFSQTQMESGFYRFHYQSGFPTPRKDQRNRETHVLSPCQFFWNSGPVLPILSSSVFWKMRVASHSPLTSPRRYGSINQNESPMCLSIVNRYVSIEGRLSIPFDASSFGETSGFRSSSSKSLIFREMSSLLLRSGLRSIFIISAIRA